jgi:hypothetical protein
MRGTLELLRELHLAAAPAAERQVPLDVGVRGR